MRKTRKAFALLLAVVLSIFTNGSALAMEEVSVTASNGANKAIAPNSIAIAPRYLLQGDGSISDPYLIHDETELRDAWLMGNNQYYKLMADISLTSKWTPFASDPAYPFTGVFDGNGFTISDIEILSGSNNGFFGFVQNATIRNLNLKNVTLTGGGSVGALAAEVQMSTINNCTATNVNITASGANAGGLVGYARGTGIYNSWVRDVEIEGATNLGGFTGFLYYNGSTGCTLNKTYAVNVIVTGKTKGDNIGGHTGRVERSQISESFSSGEVKSIVETYQGGLIGYSLYHTTVADSFSTCNVENYYSNNTSSYYSGGIIGRADYYTSFNRVYASGTIKATNASGIAGHIQVAGNQDCSIINSFVLNPKVTTSLSRAYRLTSMTSNSINSIKLDNNYALDIGEFYSSSGLYRNALIELQNSYSGKDITLTDAKRVITYKNASWDFENIWEIDENNSYPYLKFAGDIADSTTPSEPIPPSSKLVKPTKLTVEEKGNELYLTWGKVSGATKYYVIINGTSYETTSTNYKINADTLVQKTTNVHVIAANSAEQSPKSMELTIKAQASGTINVLDPDQNLIEFGSKYVTDWSTWDQSPANLMDGVMSTFSFTKATDNIDTNNSRWQAVDTSLDISFTVEFMGNVSLNEIVMKEFKNKINNYEIEYLDEDTGVYMKFVDNVKPNAANQDILINGFGTITTSKLRFTFHKKPGALDGIALRELGVYYR